MMWIRAEMRARSIVGRRPGAALALVLLVASLAGQAVSADSILTDFNAAAAGSYNPRAGWSAFGNGTADRGVHMLGSVGNCAYHSIDWSGASWGIGDVATASIDLSAYTAIRIDARIVDTGGHTGIALFAFALDLPGGAEWSSPNVALSSTYQTLTFNFADLTRTAGSGALNLAAGTPKFLVRKNGQTGTARFDFDEIRLIGGAPAEFVLNPVTLNPPWDGDDVRAMWLYASGANPRVDNAAGAQAILDFCAHEGVNRIYFGAYSVWAQGSAELKQNLRTFLNTAHASGIRVEALLDGTNWQYNPALVQTRVAQILAIHDATPGNAQDNFDAIHFDIEFWLDPTWPATEPQNQPIARQFLDNVLVNTRGYLDGHNASAVGIGVDLSTHFDSASMLPSPMLYNGVTQYFIQHVLDHADDVVLMSYYDSVSALLNTTNVELDYAAAKGRRIQLGADVEPTPPEVATNTFRDNLPTPYAAMTTVLQNFHTALAPSRLAALDGFSVFNFDGYATVTPSALNRADLDGNGTVNVTDFSLFAAYLRGPNLPATGVARDADYDGSGAVDLADFARFAACFTGDNCGCPVPLGCRR